MKIKIDLYSKIVLTAIAIFLGIIVFKDINFVTKAQASPLDLSNMKVEDASDDEGTTFFVYENDKILGGFGKKEYTDYSHHSSQPSLYRKGYEEEYKKAHINTYYDTPKYIITNKKGSFWLEK